MIGGYKQMADITMGYGSLVGDGRQGGQGRGRGDRRRGQERCLAGGGELAYDRLIVSPGIDFMFEQVGGLEAAVTSGAVSHAWKAGPADGRAAPPARGDARRRGVRDGDPEGALPLPARPYERACMVASYLKKAKPKAKILVMDANPEITSKKALFERAFKTVLRRHPRVPAQRRAEGSLGPGRPVPSSTT